MINRLKKFFGQPAPAPAPPSAAEQQMKAWYEHKCRLMEEMLGPQHDTAMHAIFPYAVGGALDLYYYPHGVPGTAIATRELTELPNEGSSNRVFSCYELVMFTRHPVNLAEARDSQTAFGKAHGNISQVLNAVARYSAQASLNPNETCEFPAGMKDLGGKCLIFDSAGQRSDERVKTFGLLTVIEIFRPEMHFAMEHEGADLIGKLKAAGHYPYSDMDRAPVV